MLRAKGSTIDSCVPLVWDNQELVIFIRNLNWSIK
jgi:hypothetical protein